MSRIHRVLAYLVAIGVAVEAAQHYLPDRVRAHVLICMLGCYLSWHLRAALAPLTYTDDAPPARNNPVAPATRSQPAATKASRHLDTDGEPLHSFPGLLEHLATLTRNTITLGQASFDKITTPTATQHRAFELIGAPLPLSLK